MNRNKGITLVALVVTVIILLILAGISISTLTNTGLFEKAREAEQESKNAQEKENSTLSNYENIMNEYLSGTAGNNKQEQDKEEENKEITITIDSNYETGETKQIKVIKNTEIDVPIIQFEREGYYSVKYNTKSDGTGEDYKIGDKFIAVQDIIIYTIWIQDNVLENAKAAKPANSTIIETDENKGIVMVDSNENEWVWVEVPKSIYTNPTYTSANNNNNVTSATDFDGIYKILKKYTNAYRKSYSDEWYYGCGLTNNQYKETYEKMLSSVFINRGFWISRYEVGDAKATASNTTRIRAQSGIAVSKQDQIPFNYVSTSQAQTLAETLKTDNKTSSLLFGIQWDLTCKFIEEKTELVVEDINSNSTDWGNYANKVLPLNRGKYNISPGNSKSVWTSYKEQTESYVSNSQKLSGAGVLLTTGASDTARMMNIYDFAGNELELTLENSYSSTVPHISRGGSSGFYGSSLPASYHSRSSTNDSYSYNNAFRAALY